MTYLEMLQNLAAAFILGVLSHHAFTIKWTLMRGAGVPFLRDRRRLIIILFVLSAVLWTNLTFLGFAMPSSTACQATTIFSTLADQIARCVATAILLEVVRSASRSRATRSGLAALLGVRSLLAIVFVAFTRPQLAPICLASSSRVPLSTLLVVLDGMLVAVVTIRYLKRGVWRNAWTMPETTGKEQSKAMIFFTAGYSLWFVTSIPMLLGIPSVPLFFRVAMPSVGLYLLLAFINHFQGALVHEPERSPPSSPSLEAFYPGRGGNGINLSEPSEVSQSQFSPNSVHAKFHFKKFVKGGGSILSGTSRAVHSSHSNDKVYTPTLTNGAPTPPAKDYLIGTVPGMPTTPKSAWINKSLLGSWTNVSGSNTVKTTGNQSLIHASPRPSSRPSSWTPREGEHRDDGVSRLASFQRSHFYSRKGVESPLARIACSKRSSFRLRKTSASTAKSNMGRSPSLDSLHCALLLNRRAEIAEAVRSNNSSSQTVPSPSVSRATNRDGPPAAPSASSTAQHFPRPKLDTMKELPIPIPEPHPLRMDNLAKMSPSMHDTNTSGITPSYLARPASPFSAQTDTMTCLSHAANLKQSARNENSTRSSITPTTQSTARAIARKPIPRSRVDPGKAAEILEQPEPPEGDRPMESVMNRSRFVRRAEAGRAIFPRQDSPEPKKRKGSSSSEFSLPPLEKSLRSRSPSPGPPATPRSVHRISTDRTTIYNKEEETLLPARCYTRQKKAIEAPTPVPALKIPSATPALDRDSFRPAAPSRHVYAPSFANSLRASSTALQLHGTHESMPSTPSSSIYAAYSRAPIKPTVSRPSLAPTVGKWSADDQLVTFMLDSDDAFSIQSGSVFTQAPATKAERSRPTSKDLPWHQRVGDEPPTFSSRRNAVRSKVMIAPSPLQLQPSGGRKSAASSRKSGSRVPVKSLIQDIQHLVDYQSPSNWSSPTDSVRSAATMQPRSGRSIGRQLSRRRLPDPMDDARAQGMAPLRLRMQSKEMISNPRPSSRLDKGRRLGLPIAIGLNSLPPLGRSLLGPSYPRPPLAMAQPRQDRSDRDWRNRLQLDVAGV